MQFFVSKKKSKYIAYCCIRRCSLVVSASSAASAYTVAAAAAAAAAAVAAAAAAAADAAAASALLLVGPSRCFCTSHSHAKPTRRVLYRTLRNVPGTNTNNMKQNTWRLQHVLLLSLLLWLVLRRKNRRTRTR